MSNRQEIADRAGQDLGEHLEHFQWERFPIGYTEIEAEIHSAVLKGVVKIQITLFQPDLN